MLGQTKRLDPGGRARGTGVGKVGRERKGDGERGEGGEMGLGERFDVV